MNYVDSWYMNEIGKIPLLGSDEEKELARLSKKGDVKAREKLINSNLRFVVKVAMKFKGCGMDLEDIICEGNAGLIKAVEKFNPEKNIRFTTYAIWWIRESIFKALNETGCMIRVPKAKLTGSEKSKWYVSSLDAEIDEESGTCAGDLIMDKMRKTPEEEYIEKESMELAVSLCSSLSENERNVLFMRYGFNRDKAASLAEVSRKLSYSKEGVRQIERRAINKLKSDCKKLAA